MNRLREIRLLRGLTQYQLAKLVGTSQARIWQWEHGYYTPKEEMKYALAKALDVTVKELFPLE